MISIAGILGTGSVAAGELRMPHIFADHMVLQQGVELPVWGWAKPGQSVSVSFGENSVAAEADADGKWLAKLPPMPASAESRQLVVTSGDDKLSFSDVLVGEVWFASGQSNMQFGLASSNGAAEAIADADSHPLIRLCSVPMLPAAKPLEDSEITWAVCSSQSVPHFSAVAYLFGRELQQARGGVPVGLIHSSWGGTSAESWVSHESLAKLDFMAGSLTSWQKQAEAFDEPAAAAARQQAMAKWEQAAQAAKARSTTVPAKPEFNDPNATPHRPTSLYNGMVSPVAPYAIRGAIWYQGESNASRWFQYRRLMGTLIEDWRRTWNVGDFPFLFVQLANYMEEQGEPNQKSADWPLLRDAQLQTLGVPNTGMASAIDVGEAADIHPRNKLDVGRRLALAARAVAYGEDVEHSGPVYKSMRHDGQKLVLSFDHVGGGLAAKGEKLKGFGIAGEDGRWAWADAQIAGDTVVLSSSEIEHPVSFCYGWANNPIGNLYNAEGLPAIPFSVDAALQVVSSPLDAEGRTELTIHTGSEQAVAMELSVGDGGQIEGDAKAQVVRDHEAKFSIVAADASRPLPVTVRLPSGRQIAHWLRPGALVAPKAGEITIDGELSDWAAAGGLEASWFDADDPRFEPQMRLSWSGDALLVSGVLPVSEAVPAVDPRQFWQGDCVELFLDATDKGVTGWSDTAHQLWFCPVRDEQGAWRLYAGEFKRGNAVVETIYDDSRCQTAMNIRDGSIVFEIKVPTAVLGAAPQAGQKWRLGLAVQRAGGMRNGAIHTAMSAGWPRAKGQGLLDGTGRWGLIELQDQSK